MDFQVSEQQWGLLYFRKKTKFNEYSQFKAKSFQYQQLMGKLHFLASQDQHNNQKQIKQYINALNGLLEQFKNIISGTYLLFSEMHQQMKFLKLQSLASLIQSFEELISSMHHYNIQDKKNQIQYKNNQNENQQDFTNQNCQKCTRNINKINIRTIFDQITTTYAQKEEENSKMTKQERRKMISQLDEYDILIAQKDNYLRKVNAVLQNKGKVCELSSMDKTYNFLSEYLSTIQKLQEKRTKGDKQDPNAFNQEQNEAKWQEESYKHIVEYIKRVIFEHFVNECSRPVKKMFKKINIDKIFKSYKDHTLGSDNAEKFTSIKNHETQTIMTDEGEQLKMIERRMQFKVKQIATLKTNKDQLQKKYITCLETNRKIQSQTYELKRQKKTLQAEIKTMKQNIILLNNKYKEKVEQFEEEQRRTFQNNINERQKIIRISRQLQADFRILQTEHKKMQSSKKKHSSIEDMVSIETQTGESSTEEQNGHQIDSMSKTQPYGLKRKKSLLKNNILASFKGVKRSYSRQMVKGFLGEIKQEDVADQSLNEGTSQNLEINLKLVSQVINLQVYLTDEESSGLLKDQKDKEDKNKPKKTYKLNKYSRNKFLKTQQTLNTTDIEDDHSAYPDIEKSKRIKLNMTFFRKPKKQKTTPNLNVTSKDYKFSKFNRFTENDADLSSDKQKFNLVEEQNESDNDEQKKKSTIKEKRIVQVSERLYKKKEKENSDLPFERVIQKGKEKFYIKTISRESINYKAEKEKIKQISQILKPYVYNSNNNMITTKRQQSINNLKYIRQRLSQLSHSQKRFSVDRRTSDFREETENANGSNTVISRHDQFNKERRQSKESYSTNSKRVVGKDIITVQHIIESEFAYLKAVGFIDFIMKIGNENKKIVKAMSKIEGQVRHIFKKPTSQDLQLFGGSEQAENYIRGKNFWSIENMMEKIMIYTKNDGLSTKVQKYFNLLRRANPELYGTLTTFLMNPIFAVFGKQVKSNHEVSISSEDNCFVKDLFNQLQKYHKIKHNECTHIADFLQKIGFYRYTYF